MEFKRVLFLKKQMAQKLGRGSPELGEQDIFAMDALTLAYIGDACWSFFVRKALIDTGIYNVQILNSLASEMVSARQQSRILFEIKELLSDRELKVCKRARNTHSTVPKSATVEEYRESLRHLKGSWGISICHGRKKGLISLWDAGFLI